MTLDQKIEGVLFYKAAPVKKSALAKLLNCSDQALAEALTVLKERLSDSQKLVISDTEVELALSADLDDLLDELRKDELKRDIGKAGAETLAIVLYRGPISRSEIDYIRGVNSSYILRNLEVRGLIERSNRGRQLEFRATTDLLRHLGIGEKTELEDYGTIMNSLENYEKQIHEDE